MNFKKRKSPFSWEKSVNFTNYAAYLESSGTLNKFEALTTMHRIEMTESKIPD